MNRFVQRITNLTKVKFIESVNKIRNILHRLNITYNNELLLFPLG